MGVAELLGQTRVYLKHYYVPSNSLFILYDDQNVINNIKELQEGALYTPQIIYKLLIASFRQLGKVLSLRRHTIFEVWRGCLLFYLTN